MSLQSVLDELQKRPGASAGNLKKVMLELGGKSPVLIYDDADLDKAIMMAAMGIFVHSGQGCVCVQGSSYSAVSTTR